MMFYVFRKANSRCNILNWDYTKLSQMGFENALDYVQNTAEQPKEISCLKNDNNEDTYFDYSGRDLSIVAEVHKLVVYF